MMVDVFRFHHFVYLKISYISTVFVWLHVKLPVQAWSITVSRSIIRIISFRSLFDPWSPPRLNETERNHWSRPCRQTSTPAFTGPTRAGLVGRRSASTELIQSIAAAPSSGFHLRRWQQPRICHRKVLGLVTKVWNPGATIRVVCVCVCHACCESKRQLPGHDAVMKPNETRPISPHPNQFHQNFHLRHPQAHWALARHLVLLWLHLLGQPIEQQTSLPQ